MHVGIDEACHDQVMGVGLQLGVGMAGDHIERLPDGNDLAPGDGNGAVAVEVDGGVRAELQWIAAEGEGLATQDRGAGLGRIGCHAAPNPHANPPALTLLRGGDLCSVRSNSALLSAIGEGRGDPLRVPTPPK
jgi:hypothetical protein